MSVTAFMCTNPLLRTLPSSRSCLAHAGGVVIVVDNEATKNTSVSNLKKNGPLVLRVSLRSLIPAVQLGYYALAERISTVIN